jgi:hypothetical protein
MIIIIIVFWMIICTHRLIFYEIHDQLCNISTNLSAALYHTVYVFIGGGVCPSMIMVVSACLIRRNLARKRQRRMQLATIEHHRNSLDQQVHSLLFIQIIFYIIFTTPQMCNVIFNAISVSNPNRSQDYRAVERLVSFIGEVMLYLFPVTSFYLYTLTARTFRSELVKFIRLALRRPARTVPMTDVTAITQRA